MATKTVQRRNLTASSSQGGVTYKGTDSMRVGGNSALKPPSVPLRYTDVPSFVPSNNPVNSKSGDKKSSGSKKNNENKKANKAALFKSRAKLFLYIVVFFAVGIWMISRYINIYEGGSEVAKLKSEYAKIETENQQLKLQIDKSVDLKVLEGVATERFGMVRPERYQLFYIDMQMSDYGEKVARKNDKAQMDEAMVYGVPGVLIKAIETLK